MKTYEDCCGPAVSGWQFFASDLSTFKKIAVLQHSIVGIAFCEDGQATESLLKLRTNQSEVLPDLHAFCVEFCSGLAIPKKSSATHRSRFRPPSQLWRFQQSATCLHHMDPWRLQACYGKSMIWHTVSLICKPQRSKRCAWKPEKPQLGTP